MKVLIVGAGQQGHVITWNLGRNPAVTEVVVSDYDLDRARLIVKEVERGRPGRSRSMPPTLRP